MPFNSDTARSAARVRQPCRFCGRRLRPCNLYRHIDAKHQRELAGQLTIRDELAERRRPYPPSEP